MNKIIFLIKIGIITFLIFLLGNASVLKNSRVENENMNKTVDLNTMAQKIEEEEKNNIYSVKDSYTGDLTGYAANCPLCTGKLACLWKYEVNSEKTTYYDETYGELYIVASSKNLPCGSVIRFNSKRISSDTVYAIVLDRGVLGNAIDLLVESESYASKYIGRSSIYYEVVRNGWEN